MPVMWGSAVPIAQLKSQHLWLGTRGSGGVVLCTALLRLCLPAGCMQLGGKGRMHVNDASFVVLGKLMTCSIRRRSLGAAP